MTEDEYINAKHLGHIMSVKAILTHITPDGDGVVPVKEYNEIVSKISEIETRLFDSITVTPSAPRANE